MSDAFQHLRILYNAYSAAGCRLGIFYPSRRRGTRTAGGKKTAPSQTSEKVILSRAIFCYILPELEGVQRDGAGGADRH